MEVSLVPKITMLEIFAFCMALPVVASISYILLKSVYK